MVPFERMVDASRAALRAQPDPDGIRRVPIIAKGAYRNPWFCLTADNQWYLEEHSTDGVVGDLTTVPRLMPHAWHPEEFPL